MYSILFDLLIIILRTKLIHTFESVGAMYDILVIALSCLTGYANSKFFCWAFPFITSIKEVKPSNVFCCSADFGFFFKKLKNLGFSSSRAVGRADGMARIPTAPRIQEPNTLVLRSLRHFRKWSQYFKSIINVLRRTTSLWLPELFSNVGEF